MLAEKHIGHADGADRADRADQRGAAGTDAADRVGQQEHRQHGGEQRHPDRKLIYPQRQIERAQRAHHAELQQAGRARHHHRIGGEARGADARDGVAGSDQIGRIGQGAEEHQRGSQHHAAALAHARIVKEHQRDTRIAQCHRDENPAADGALVEQRGEDHRHGRVEEQDQPLQARRDVLQPEKIQVAGKVVAEQSEREHQQLVLSAERLGVAQPGPDRDTDEERHRECHAQRQQGDRVDMVEIGELDQDGLGREADRREQRKDHAEYYIAVDRHVSCIARHYQGISRLAGAGLQDEAMRSGRLSGGDSTCSAAAAQHAGRNRHGDFFC